MRPQLDGDAMLKMADYFPSPFLKGTDFDEGETRRLTIKYVKEEAVGRQKELKAVAYFCEEEKGWVLNKTNWKTIEKAYGDTDNWTGKPIELFGAMVEYGGDIQPGIRVRIPKPVKEKAPSSPQVRVAADELETFAGVDPEDDLPI